MRNIPSAATGTDTNSHCKNSDSDSEEDICPLRCWDCNINFTSKHYLYNHLLHHIKQPVITLDRVQLPPLKITFRNRSGNSFEIINSPTSDLSKTTSNLEEFSEDTEGGGGDANRTNDGYNEEENHTRVCFSPNYAVGDGLGFSECSDTSNQGEKRSDTVAGVDTTNASNDGEYGSVPGAEPTPPPEPSPVYPKIKIKTTGLFKDPSESLTITEITDDNPSGDPNVGNNSNMWTTPSLDEPLKMPANDDNNIMALFNNNDRAKELGFSSSENEFISLDRFEERNRGTIQLYNPNTSQAQNPLDSLTGLPMQALAQQVSRLQPSGNGMHQQNVLINIQQFPTGPPQPAYQPPPMYPQYPPPAMHQPYQYQPPNPMYYPPSAGYPPQHMPHPPQMGPMGQPPISQAQMGQAPMNQPPMSQPQSAMVPSSQGQNANQMMSQPQPPYRQPMPPRPVPPRQQVPGQRMPGPRQPMAPRQPMTRQRAPMVRPRGGGMSTVRGMRPRMVGPQNNMRPQHSQHQQPMKRTPEQLQSLQAKKKRLDVLTPSDKDDDDCQVICMQPKNTDGGLPQIESVQGGTQEPAESSIMHLSDSITLSVRNPPPKPVQPQKSDAKAVANILATRGITVTATPKAKEKSDNPQKNPSTLPTALSLNGSVSIVAAPKTNNPGSPPSALPTVDLTEDNPSKLSAAGQKPNGRPGLPYKCDLCPAQYPNAPGLGKHRQTYHKTNGGVCELGVPVVNLKQPGIMQRLSSLGIQNYIPLTAAGADGMFALPVISTRNPGNVANLGATQMLSLGPIRSIPKAQNAMQKQGNAKS